VKQPEVSPRNVHPCTCAGPEQPFGVVLPVALPLNPAAAPDDWRPGEWHEFLGGGATADEAVTDAERHARALLGDDTITDFARPA
jgi:hypothetical protein